MTALCLQLAVFLAILIRHECSAFAPTHITKNAPITFCSTLATSCKHSLLASRGITTNLYSNSIEQAEQLIINQYPKFYYLLQQNPTCLNRIRNSSRGFAVFVPTEEAMDALGDSLNLLEYGIADLDMLPIVQSMTAYHLVAVPVTTNIMSSFNVVSTSEGELPVHVQDGSIYVNEVRVVQCYRFEDSIVKNYQDKEGNLLGSETMHEEGRVCLIYEMEGMVCPKELWGSLFECYQSKNSGASTT